MKVKLTCRLGQNQPGAVIQVSDTEGGWLLHRGYGKRVDEPQPVETATQLAVVDGNTEDDPEPVLPDDTTSHSLADLKTLAESLGLKTYGSKAQLAARIRAAEKDSHQ